MLYKYKGFHGCDSICDIKVYENIVVATELNDNQGTSITNMAEVIATDIAKKYYIKMRKLIWLETYNNPPLNNRAHFDIKNNRFTDPAWEPITKEYIQDLIKDKKEKTEYVPRNRKFIQHIPIILKVIIIGVVIVIIIPLFIDFCIIGNGFKSNIENNEWISFLGSYLGSVVSSVASLIGILWTIKYTKEQAYADREFAIKQANEDRRLQHAPYLKIDYNDKLVTNNTFFAIFDNIPELEEGTINMSIDIVLKNIGSGPIIDMLLKTSDDLKNKAIHPIEEIEEKSETHITLSVYFVINYDKMKDLQKLSGNKVFETNIGRKGTFFIEYRDILQNKYRHEVIILIDSTISVDNDNYTHTGSRVKVHLEKNQKTFYMD